MVAEQLCLEEAVFRRKTVRGNVFARNVGNGTKLKGSVQTSSPRWAGSRNALVQSSVWVRLKEGTDLCFGEVCDQPQGHAKAWCQRLEPPHQPQGLGSPASSGHAPALCTQGAAA